MAKTRAMGRKAINQLSNYERSAGQTDSQMLKVRTQQSTHSYSVKYLTERVETYENLIYMAFTKHELQYQSRHQHG